MCIESYKLIPAQDMHLSYWTGLIITTTVYVDKQHISLIGFVKGSLIPLYMYTVHV